MATAATATMLSQDVGESIPPHTAHVSNQQRTNSSGSIKLGQFLTAQAVSVSLPTWKANVGYEEGEDWVLSKMKTGYPRCVFI